MPYCLDHACIRPRLENGETERVMAVEVRCSFFWPHGTDFFLLRVLCIAVKMRSGFTTLRLRACAKEKAFHIYPF